ncbi:MAG: hypothetical protein ACJ71B_08880 [Nitrososphaera sp.]
MTSVLFADAQKHDIEWNECDQLSANEERGRPPSMLHLSSSQYLRLLGYWSIDEKDFTRI